jgi:hypothetical protein
MGHPKELNLRKTQGDKVTVPLRTGTSEIAMLEVKEDHRPKLRKYVGSKHTNIGGQWG